MCFLGVAFVVLSRGNSNFLQTYASRLANPMIFVDLGVDFRVPGPYFLGVFSDMELRATSDENRPSNFAIFWKIHGSFGHRCWNNFWSIFGPFAKLANPLKYRACQQKQGFGRSRSESMHVAAKPQNCIRESIKNCPTQLWNFA